MGEKGLVKMCQNYIFCGFSHNCSAALVDIDQRTLCGQVWSGRTIYTYIHLVKSDCIHILLYWLQSPTIISWNRQGHMGHKKPTPHVTSNIRHKDFRSYSVQTLCVTLVLPPPCIMKCAGLESSGQIAYS